MTRGPGEPVQNLHKGFNGQIVESSCGCYVNIPFIIIKSSDLSIETLKGGVKGWFFMELWNPY